MLPIIESKTILKEGIDRYLSRTTSQLDDLRENVTKMINNVKASGDKALIDYTLEFDKVDLTEIGIKVTKEEIEEAYSYVDEKLVVAIRDAIKNIDKFHKAQIRDEWFIETIKGVKAGQVLRPIESVGIYVPGGQAVYPSTVLMTAVPARAAGVKRLVICSPPGKFKIKEKEYIGISPAILVAANECGVEDVFKLGSAWAIAAMAYGTPTVPSVLKIIGPGNKFVNAAKLIVKDVVSIDTPAGPSEVGIIIDQNANAKFIAYDLLSQVEHGKDNIAVLLCHDKDKIDEVIDNIEKILKISERNEIIEENLKENSIAILTDNIEQSITICNDIAPEHLEIVVDNYKDILPKIQNAGAIFLGPYSSVPLGDYCAGTNHVLPTGGGAKRFSGLNTLDFMKIIDVLEVSQDGINELAEILTPLAEYEGLFMHRDAVKIRLKK